MGKNGGARPGAGRKKARHTIQAEAYRAFIVAEVIKEKKPIIEAMIARAKRGDVQAFKELNDRALGKASQPVGLDDDAKEALKFLWQNEP